MNAQADREALQSFITKHGTHAAPTGAAYIAADGTLWHQYTTTLLDGIFLWATTRVDLHHVLTAYTYRITNDTMVLEDVF